MNHSKGFVQSSLQNQIRIVTKTTETQIWTQSLQLK